MKAAGRRDTERGTDQSSVCQEKATLVDESDMGAEDEAGAGGG